MATELDFEIPEGFLTDDLEAAYAAAEIKSFEGLPEGSYQVKITALNPGMTAEAKKFVDFGFNIVGADDDRLVEVPGDDRQWLTSEVGIRILKETLSRLLEQLEVEGAKGMGLGAILSEAMQRLPGRVVNMSRKRNKAGTHVNTRWEGLIS